MPQSRTGSVDPEPALYRRIRFNPSLEAEASACLSEFDLDGTRAALGRLLETLDVPPSGPGQREFVHLLLDVLLRIAARVHHEAAEPDLHHASRAALVERFAACENAREASEAFLPALNRLLAPLRQRSGDGRQSHVVERARACVEENYHRRLSLSTVAAQLHVSPNYLSRVFHGETGLTITAFIHRTRLEHARFLLAGGRRSISEIAYLVGYQTYRDFYRNFVKYEKASPRAVQRRLRGRAAPPSPPERGAGDER